MKLKNNTLPRCIALVLILALCIAMFTACGEEDLTAEEVDTELLTTLYEINKSAVFGAPDTATIANYIYEWGMLNDKFKVSHDSHDNVIISTTATDENYENSASTILHCSLDINTPDRTAQAMTAIMYILQYSENHGFIRALFTEPTQGLENIKESYLTADNFVTLDSAKNNTIITTAASRHDYRVTKEITYQEATYTNAFEITIMGLVGTHAGKTTQLNAVKTLGKMLAELKSTGALIEIVSLCSGYMDEDGNFAADITPGTSFPRGAQAIVLVNDNDVNKLTKKVTKSQSKTIDKYQETNPDIVYNFNEVDRTAYPMVISPDDTSAIISFIYTSLYGIYDKDDEGEPIAVNNITYCTTSGGSFEIDLTAISLSESKMETLDKTVSTLCGLYDLEHEKLDIADLWEMAQPTDSETGEPALDEDGNPNYRVYPIVDAMCAAAYDIYEKDTQFGPSFENASIVKVLERIPDANIIAYGVTDKNLERQTATLLTFCERL
ncbi:MAG: hypothetical protein IK059_01130 [Firmicutes bacterium]|nr:hypothetical protein [Bacillota bacterium]